MDGISVSRKEAQGACLSLALYEDTENKQKKRLSQNVTTLVPGSGPN